MLFMVLDIFARVLTGDLRSSESSLKRGSLLGESPRVALPAEIDLFPIIMVLEKEYDRPCSPPSIMVVWFPFLALWGTTGGSIPPFYLLEAPTLDFFPAVGLFLSEVLTTLEAWDWFNDLLPLEYVFLDLCLAACRIWRVALASSFSLVAEIYTLESPPLLLPPEKSSIMFEMSEWTSIVHHGNWTHNHLL